MSIFKIINNEDTTISNLQKKLIYITRIDATERSYIYGASVSIYNPYVEMLLVKETFSNITGKAYFHYVLSPEENEENRLDRLYKFGIEVAELIANFHGHYQVLMAVHIDTLPRYHIHLIANNIDYCSGLRLNLDKKKLYELKNDINEILDRYNLSRIRQSSPLK